MLLLLPDVQAHGKVVKSAWSQADVNPGIEMILTRLDLDFSTAPSRLHTAFHPGYDHITTSGSSLASK
jgi:hypothetical protein